MKTRKNRRLVDSSSSSKQNKITHVFLEMLLVIKLYHWKTHSYAQHKSTDELYGKLNESIDRFVETMLGRNQSRLNFQRLSFVFPNISQSASLRKKIKGYKYFLQNLPDMGSDLMNIRDEILGELDQFLYLFSFH